MLGAPNMGERPPRNMLGETRLGQGANSWLSAPCPVGKMVPVVEKKWETVLADHRSGEWIERYRKNEIDIVNHYNKPIDWKYIWNTKPWNTDARQKGAWGKRKKKNVNSGEQWWRETHLATDQMVTFFSWLHPGGTSEAPNPNLLPSRIALTSWSIQLSPRDFIVSRYYMLQHPTICYNMLQHVTTHLYMCLVYNHD